MAVFRNPDVSEAIYSQGARVGLRKSVGHIPNFVIVVASVLLVFYLFENRYFICFVKFLFLESKLLAASVVV
jgi:hypothetical protein